MRETLRDFGGSVVELRPVAHADANTIFESWGRHAENFSYLTARVFADVRAHAEITERILRRTREAIV
jgi:hypothetical protein